MQDRRPSQRARTLRAGKILFNNRRSVIDCMVRNVSTRGACLLLPSVVGVPQVFDLVIHAIEHLADGVDFHLALFKALEREFDG